MIITKLQGGLGNQLFQWAVTKSLSKKYECDYKFEMSYFSSINSRPLDILKFKNVKIPILDKYYKCVTPVNVVNDNFRYKDIQDNSFLNGYWQTEKYFYENKEEIRNCLQFPLECEEKIFNKYPFLNKECTSVHIRRGDYIGLPDFHPLQDVSYYDNSLKTLSAENIVVLSDDIDWCKQNLRLKNCLFVEKEDNLTTLKIMSLCKNNVIANSSFSWWGAWLNPNKDKRVVAPKKWFGPSGPSYWQDIYCDGWEII